jgi:hypothetical protein
MDECLEKCQCCEEPIEDLQLVRIDERVYHCLHFNCQNCQKNLCQKFYFEIKGLMYCEQCYTEQHRKTCYHCEEHITEEKFVQVGQKYYHKAHFFCHDCRQPFGEQENRYYLNEQGEYQCNECYHASAKKCIICDRIIDDSYLNFQDGLVHAGCFVCGICSGVIESYYC